MSDHKNQRQRKHLDLMLNRKQILQKRQIPESLLLTIFSVLFIMFKKSASVSAHSLCKDIPRYRYEIHVKGLHFYT